MSSKPLSISNGGEVYSTTVETHHWYVDHYPAVWRHWEPHVVGASGQSVLLVERYKEVLLKIACSDLSEDLDVKVLMYTTASAPHTSVNEYLFSIGGNHARDGEGISSGAIKRCPSNPSVWD